MESKAVKDEKGLQPDSTPKIIYLTDEARAQKLAKCPYCGTETSIDAGKCEHCGKQIEISADSADRSQDRPVNFDSLGYVKSALASKYQVLEEVARTDTSTVFRAIHLQLRREVALKVLSKRTTQDRDFTDRFHRRARAIDRLSQNNIITILDEGVDNGVHYMAMEFLKGVDLQRKISEDGAVSPDELVSILMPAIGALGHAHSNGILHGNLKCGSIFLHDDGRIILFGFGIPYLTKGNLISFKRDANTAEYLSPEEANGKSVDGRSDIYSLGVIMYYALTGRFPYTGIDRSSTVAAILGHQYVPINKLRQVPQWLERIVDKCLQRDISKRVQSCAELLGLLNIRPPSPRPVQPPPVELTQPEVKPPEPIKEKPVDLQVKPDEVPKAATSSSKPAVSEEKRVVEEKHLPLEVPAKDESLGEQPTIEFSAPEVAHAPVPKEASVQAKQKEKIAPTEKTIAQSEQTQTKKGKSKAFTSVIAIVVVIIVGAAATLIMMHKGAVNGSATPQVSIPEQSQGSNDENNQSSSSQENAGGGQTENQNGVAASSGSAAQEENSSGQDGVSSSEQNASGNQEVSISEKSRPIAPKVESKSRVVSERRAPSPAPKRSASEESRSVSTPPPPVVQMVSVPDLIGTQLRVAKSILSLNGLKVGAVSTIPDPVNDGMVIRQVPKPGTQLKKGSTVNLILGTK